MSIDPAKVQAIVRACPPHLHHQLADVVEHVASLADPKLNPGGRVPRGDGGNVASFLAKQDPAIVHIIESVLAAAELPRDRPFTDKYTEAERFQQFGMPANWQTVKDAIDGMYVMGGLTKRMGHDADRPPQPVRLREQVAAAADLEEPAARRAAYGDAELASAGRESGLSLRDTIEVTGNIKAESLGYAYDPNDYAIGNDDSSPDSMRGAIEKAMVTHGE